MKSFVRLFALVSTIMCGAIGHISALAGEVGDAPIDFEISIASVIDGLASEESVVDPIKVARTFAGKKIANCDGWASFFVYVPEENRSIFYYATFTYVPDVGIIEMSIEYDGRWNSIVTANDPPLPGFPVGSFGQVENFGVGVWAYDQFNDSIGSGHSNIGAIVSGTPIRIELKPNAIMKFLAYVPPPGVDLRNIVLVTKYGRFHYRSDLGGFIVWVDPSMTTPYEIVYQDSGDVVTSGEIDPFDVVPPSGSGYSHLNFGYIGGVEKIRLSTTYTLINQVPAPIDVPERGSASAKVYFTDNLNGQQLYIYAGAKGWSDEDFEIVVYRQNLSGPMEIIGQGSPAFYTSSEQGALIIVVISRQGVAFDLRMYSDGGKGGAPVPR